MSCYMCSDKMISQLSNAIYKSLISSSVDTEASPRLKYKIYEVFCIKGEYDNRRTVVPAIFNHLHDLNEIAVNGRYNKDNHSPGKLTGDRIKYQDYTEYLIRLSNKLSCFLYQCAEDPADGTGLYKVLCDYKSEVNQKLAYKMADRLGVRGWDTD